MQRLLYTRTTRGVSHSANMVVLNRTIMGRNYYNNMKHYAEILPKVLRNTNKIGVAGPTSYFLNEGHVHSSETDHGEQKSKVEPRRAPFVKPVASMWRVSTVPLPLAPWVQNPRDMAPSPPGRPKHSVFKCPWQCFWKCHSYCPKRCCNNPYSCHIECGEWCGATCSDVCCAPGLDRMAPFKPTPKPPQLIQPPSRKIKTDKKIETPKLDAKGKNKLAVDENEISVIKELDKLRKATTHAADKIGLPPDCPAMCVQVCVPGFCASHCCLGNLMLLKKGLANQNQGSFLAHKLAEQYLPIKPTPPPFPFTRIRKLTNKEILDAKRQHLVQLQRQHRVPNPRLQQKQNFYIGGLTIAKDDMSSGNFQRTSGVTNYITKMRNFAAKTGSVGPISQFPLNGPPRTTHVLENAGKRYLPGRMYTPHTDRDSEDLASAQSALAFNNGNLFDNAVTLRHNAINDGRLIDNAINRQIFSKNRQFNNKKVSEAQRVLYNDLAFDNQLKKQNMFFNKNAAALVQEVARKSNYCAHPEMCPKTLSRIMRTCPKICSLSCIPQCPTRCCIMSQGMPPIGLSFPTEDYQP
jgi:hypothetical protein